MRSPFALFVIFFCLVLASILLTVKPLTGLEIVASVTLMAVAILTAVFDAMNRK
jgi:hypothetical protein